MFGFELVVGVVWVGIGSGAGLWLGRFGVLVGSGSGAGLVVKVVLDWQ